ncbi:glycosyltransferase family 4 protein [Akkermansiaceae bacterium]|nr:glycosyltransferase family 4 protein [Akkermansiaceae bacterium]
MWIERIRLKRFVERLHRERPFDLVESPEATGWFPFGLRSISLISRFHGGQAFNRSISSEPTSRMFKILERKQIEKSEHNVAVSRFVGRTTLSVLNISRPVDIIYNGIDLSGFSTVVESGPEQEGSRDLILFYGSIIPKKGPEELLRASFRFLKGNDFILGFAGKIGAKLGDGSSYVDFLQKMIPSELTDRIKFYGPLDRERELFPLIQKSVICCFPSRVEAFGLAPVEAMALGKPVVFTNNAAGPEVVEDGVSGLLCKPRDVEDLADKVSSLIDDPLMRESMGKAAKIRVEGMFDLEKIVNDNISYYKKCLGEI